MHRSRFLRLLACMAIGVGVAAPSGAAAAVPGMANARPRTLVVIRVVFAAQTPDPAPPATINATFHDARDSVNAFYGQQTAGQLQFRGLQSSRVDMLPAADLPPLILTMPPACELITTQLMATVIATYGTQLDAYDHVMIVFPKYNCPWSGRGQVAGRWSWINGPAAIGSPRVVAHELGHNLGADHASSWSCVDDSGGRVALSAACTVADEYGDPFDVMGSPNVYRLMSSYHRAQTGELPSAEQATFTSGDHVVTDANAPGTDRIRLLLIPRAPPPGTAATEYFAVEFRQPVDPFDAWATLALQSVGVIVRLVAAPGTAGVTKLLDMNPGTPTFDDAPLGDQRTFTDPVSGVRISLVLRTASTAVVRIGGDPLTDTIAPAFSGGALKASVVGGRVVLSWPPATDAYGVDHYEIWRDGTLVGTAPSTMGSDTLPPGTTSTYEVRAVDAAGNWTSGGTVTASVGGGVNAVPVLAPPGGLGTAPLPPVGSGVGTLPGAWATAISMAGPALVKGRGAAPSSGLLAFTAKGAGLMVIKVNGHRLAQATKATVRMRLTAEMRRRASVTVVASRGQLPRSLRLDFSVRRGLITLR